MALGQELTADGEKTHVALVKAVEDRELVAWGRFKVFEPVTKGALSENIVDTTRVLSWKLVGGDMDAQAQLVAGGYQDPYLKDGLAEISACMSPRAPYFQLILPGASKKWKKRNP